MGPGCVCCPPAKREAGSHCPEQLPTLQALNLPLKHWRGIKPHRDRHRSSARKKPRRRRQESWRARNKGTARGSPRSTAGRELAGSCCLLKAKQQPLLQTSALFSFIQMYALSQKIDKKEISGLNVIIHLMLYNWLTSPVVVLDVWINEKILTDDFYQDFGFVRAYVGW